MNAITQLLPNCSPSAVEAGLSGGTIKKARRFAARFCGRFHRSLEGSDVFRFQAFFALNDIKADLLAFRKRFEAAGLNGAEVHENIAPALLLDEAEAFALVEPLYFTF